MLIKLRMSSKTIFSVKNVYKIINNEVNKILLILTVNNDGQCFVFQATSSTRCLAQIFSLVAKFGDWFDVNVFCNFCNTIYIFICSQSISLTYFYDNSRFKLIIINRTNYLQLVFLVDWVRQCFKIKHYNLFG